jgi:hypothetical protein
MFSTIEEKIIVAAIAAVAIVVGVLGYNHHERKEGAAVCIQQQSNAATAETIKDASDVKDVLKDFSGDLSAIPIAASHTPVFMCDTPRSVRKNTAATGVKPAEIPNIQNGSGLQAGVEQRSDIGPIVQDITLSCMLGIADAQSLWNLAVKESAK